MTRTDAILEAVKAELENHRFYLDQIGTLRGLMVRVRIEPGTTRVFQVEVSPHTENRV